MTSQLITIFGATGNQGGSIITTILSSPELASKYSIRAVTRDPSKPAALALESKGCEVTQADLNAFSTVRKAVAGSYAVFGMTNFWEIFSKDTEIQQGKNIVDACKAEGVQHLVWSSLPHATTVSGGTLKHLPHFDGKAEVEKYAERVKGEMVTSYFLPAAFMATTLGSINKGPDGVPAYAGIGPAGGDAIPLIDTVADTGKFVVGLLEAGKTANGTRIQGVSEWVTPGKIPETITKATGTKVAYANVPIEVFKGFLPEQIREEIGETLLLIRDFSYYGSGSESEQPQSDKLLLKGSVKSTWAAFVEKEKPTW